MLMHFRDQHRAQQQEIYKEKKLVVDIWIFFRTYLNKVNTKFQQCAYFL